MEARVSRERGAVLVLGAGIIGTCTALHLAMRGRTVVLVDRQEPGRETSYGNAGLIQREAVLPYPFPRRPRQILQAVLKRGAAVNYHWNALPGMASGLAGYWRNSEPARYQQIARSHARLIEHATDEHAPLIAAAGAEDLVQRKGYLHVFRDPKNFEQSVARANALALSHGLQHTALDARALAHAEPALRRQLAGAIHWGDPWSVSDPGALVARYAALFQRLGGLVVRGDALTLQSTTTGWSVQTKSGRFDAEQAVIALGPWADTMLRRWGYRLPLLLKRGYHRHHLAASPPALPVYDADRGVVMAPTSQGVRVTTGAEFARIDAPKTPWQLARAETSARELFDLDGPVETEPWAGARPCTADMNPVIGAVPGLDGLWVNIGHAHQGFTLGPACGRLIAELMEGQTPQVDPKPYAFDRFS